VVHLSEQSDVEIARIAGHEVGQNLARPVGEYFVTASPSFEDDEHRAWSVAFADEVRPSGQALPLGGSLNKDANLFRRQPATPLQLCDELVPHSRTISQEVAR
jgi:hypothetical protein